VLAAACAATCLVVDVVGPLATSSAAAAAVPQTAVPDTAADTSVYVVVLRADPLATFTGDSDDAATTPREGRRFNARRPAVAAYAARLDLLQERVVARLGDPDVLYSYTTAIDGLAARLTPAQARLAEALPEVASVHADRLDRLDGSPSAATTATGAVAAAGQRASGGGHGVVIGVVDSGVWPDNPSFAAPPLDPAGARAAYPGFTGECEDAGEQWSAALCNAKLIAARSYVEGFGADHVRAAEYLSPRDGSGHGSHVAAVAAGDAGVDVRIDGQDFGRRSGVAPAAALAVYKACWTAPDPSHDGCSTADALAAVDQAVHDGVDVLNYAASSPADALDDPLETAFANAATAGVFVATSAGDRGPRPGTVAHGAPWVTTVAAAAEPTFQGGVVLGNGERAFGSMASDRAVPATRLVVGADVPARQATARAARLCLPGALDAARVQGAVVLCMRGASARVSKSAEVARAGGVAMILSNTGRGATNADVHAVPTVHVDARAGAMIRRYVATTTHPAVALDPQAQDPALSPHIASFSGRGPAVAAGDEALLPDVAAPGANVVAAVAPPFDFGRLWDVYSGTSMAVAQVSGLAAVVAARRPDWSPAAIKSAIVTTARPLPGAGAFAAGGGVVAAPRRAADPGIVYDADPARPWSNSPSISESALTGTVSITRRVTGVSASPETYTASVSGLPGLAVRVTPSTLRVSPGATERFRVTLSARRAARYDEFVTGQLTWTGSLGHVATSPIVVRPEALAAPVDVQGFGSAGEAALRSVAGVTGTLRARVIGPTAAVPTPLLLAPGDFDPAAPESSTATAARTFYVPAHSFAARFSTDLVVGGDTDLYVYRGHRLVAQAASSEAGGQITLRRPRRGLYTVYVTAPDLGDGDAVAARFTGWVLAAQTSSAPPGAGLAVNPPAAHVTGGVPVSLQLRWSGLDPSQRWLAAVRYRHSDAVTYVTVN
jgi:hypothetical protein